MPLAAAAIAGFLIGSVPCSWIVARFAGGQDIRTVGSGNVGATNVARIAGYGAGALALGLDALKGVAAVLAGRALAGEPAAGNLAPIVAGGMAVLGHMFTPWLSFRGGKGVATGAGAFALLSPIAVLSAAIVFALTLVVSRTVSLGSILAAAALPVAAWLSGAGAQVSLAALLVAVLVIARHRDNLARIAAGTERRLGKGRSA